MMKQQTTTVYQPEGQRLFNERLAARSKPTPAPDVVSGPWINIYHKPHPFKINPK